MRGLLAPPGRLRQGCPRAGSALPRGDAGEAGGGVWALRCGSRPPSLHEGGMNLERSRCWESGGEASSHQPRGVLPGPSHRWESCPKSAGNVGRQEEQSCAQPQPAVQGQAAAALPSRVASPHGPGVTCRGLADTARVCCFPGDEAGVRLHCCRTPAPSGASCGQRPPRTQFFKTTPSAVF